MNEVAGEEDTIAGGNQNNITATAMDSFIGGGDNNGVTNSYSVVSGGRDNDNSGEEEKGRGKKGEGGGEERFSS